MAIKEISHKDNIFKISYEILNHNKNKDIIFLHGWGSDKELMKSAFGNYFVDFRHIYIDLPGFGKSSNESILDTYEYKEIINKFLELLSSSKDIILGHSFGGKVAILLEPKMLILLSSAGIPTKKPIAIKAKIAFFKALKSIGLGRFYKIFASDDARDMKKNMYETFKKVVDEDFSDMFKAFSSKALVLWGEDDSATPLESGKKIASLIKNSEFYIFEGDHYFFLRNSNIVAQKIKDFIEG